MQTIDCLLSSPWIIPVEPDNLVLENHTIAINQGRIIDVLASAAAAQKYQAKETVNLPHHAIIPGLINTHTHSPMVFLRGIADDLALMEWLQHYIWPVENQWVSEDFIRDSMQLAMAEMLLSGTTCFNEHYFYPNIIAETIAESGMRARVGLQLMDVPSKWAKDIDEGIAKGLQAYEAFKQHPLVKFSLAPHAPYTLSDESLRKVKKIAEQYQLPIHIHMHETAVEVENSLKEFNRRPLKRLQQLGILSPAVQLVHMTQVNEEDIAIVQQAGAHIVHCPESNLKLASGFCPVQKLWDANLNVALGTDGAASNNDLDMLAEMQTAALLAKAVAGNPMALPAASALRMATLNGAKALGLAQEVGSIEVGKAADLVAINFASVNTQPLYHPISHLVYAAHQHQITDVWVAGKRLVKNRQLTTLDEKKILENAAIWQQKIGGA
jgi:5-methylthioadenosine/S-adenosylhomocysteine deaminase